MTGQLFQKISLNVGLSAISSLLDLVYTLSVGIPQNSSEAMLSPFQCITSGGTCCQIVTLLAMR